MSADRQTARLLLRARVFWHRLRRGGCALLSEPASGFGSPRSLLRLHWCRARAFTLVEVLLALGLFVVATGILSGTIYSGLQAYRAATNDAVIENRYRLVLRQVLAISDRTEFERGGTLRLPDGTRAQWDAVLNDDSVLLDLFEANVTIALEGELPSGSRARETERERSFNLQLYRTGWADVTERAQLLEDRRRALEEGRSRR